MIIMTSTLVQPDKIIKENLLFTHIEKIGIIDHEKHYYNYKIIKYWIEINQGRLYKSLANGAKSIILNTNKLHKPLYDHYKDKEKQVYLIDDVVSFLNSTYPDITPPKIYVNNKKNLLVFNNSPNNEIIEYINSSQNFIETEINKSDNDPSKFGFMLQNKKRYKYAMIYFIIAVKKQTRYSNVYLSLAKLFKKI